MYLLPLAFAAVGILLDLSSLVAIATTLIRRRWTPGLPPVALFFYLPAAAVSAAGMHPPRFSLLEMLLFLGGLAVLHVTIQWWHISLKAKLGRQGG